MPKNIPQNFSQVELSLNTTEKSAASSNPDRTLTRKNAQRELALPIEVSAKDLNTLGKQIEEIKTLEKRLSDFGKGFAQFITEYENSLTNKNHKPSFTKEQLKEFRNNASALMIDHSSMLPNTGGSELEKIVDFITGYNQYLSSPQKANQEKGLFALLAHYETIFDSVSENANRLEKKSNSKFNKLMNAKLHNKYEDFRNMEDKGIVLLIQHYALLQKHMGDFNKTVDSIKALSSSDLKKELEEITQKVNKAASYCNEVINTAVKDTPRNKLR